MGDSFVRLPLDSTGKKLRTWQLPNGDHAEAVVIVGPDGNLVSSPEEPRRSLMTTVELAAGASADLSATLIGAASTGKLVAISAGGSVAAKWEVFSLPGPTPLDVFYTSHMTLWRLWKPPHPDWHQLLGDGTRRFMVRVTNLDPLDAVDFTATLYWDEES